MNPTPSEPSEPTAASKPGKIRTWWHPLLANLLRWQLGNHYHLEEEVPVGQKPLQIDILLLQKEQGELPPGARQALNSSKVKSPRCSTRPARTYDALRQGGYTNLVVYLAQQVHQFRLLGKE